MMRAWLGWIVLMVVGLLLVGCMGNQYHASRDRVAHTQQTIAQLSQPKITPAVRIEPGFYVDPKPYVKPRLAPWLQQPVEVHAQAMPLAKVLSHLLKASHHQVIYADGVVLQQPVDLDYQGPLVGALDQLAGLTNHAYRLTPAGVAWDKMQTQTFNIAFMPGTSDYLIGQTANKDQSTPEGSSNHANVVTTSGHLYDAQYSNLQANLSVWHDLKTALMQLKSKQGEVMVSEATTTVTVRDTPDRVTMMAQFIKQLNHTLAQQVNVKIQVLNIELSDEYNAGINWNMIQRALGSQIKLVGALADASNLAATSVGSTASTSGLTTLTLGTTAKAVINALSEQGEVSVVTEPEVTTMNNQIAEVRITRDTGYLQSVSTTTVASEGTTTALTPGVVTDGFSLYLLPKIHQHDVYLQISSTLSTLTQLVQISNQVSGSSSTSNIQAIQVPTLSEKHFNQRTRVPSGKTLLITGFKEMHDQVKRVAPFGILAVGGVGSKHSHVQTLVMITPTIIENAD